jgi:hypothetical protein
MVFLRFGGHMPLFFTFYFFFHKVQCRSGSHHTILYDEAGVYEWDWWYYTIGITSLSSDEAWARVGLSIENG